MELCYNVTGMRAPGTWRMCVLIKGSQRELAALCWNERPSQFMDDEEKLSHLPQAACGWTFISLGICQKLGQRSEHCQMNFPKMYPVWGWEVMLVYLYFKAYYF